MAVVNNITEDTRFMKMNNIIYKIFKYDLLIELDVIFLVLSMFDGLIGGRKEPYLHNLCQTSYIYMIGLHVFIF